MVPSDMVPSGWKQVRLSDLGEVNRGRSRHRPRYAEHLYGGPYPFIQTGDVRESGGRITSFNQTYSEAGLAQSRLWPAGTMCITIAANIAETAILSFPACFPDSVVGFVADETKCDVRFVEYMFRQLKRRIQQEATGSVQDNINLATLDRLTFPVPPVTNQRTIADTLGAFDDKIELNRRMNETLEAMARAIFKSWFVDFDPVRAKAEGLKPQGIPAHVADLFPDSLQDSTFGKVPSGWRYGELSDVEEVLETGRRPKGGVGNITEGVPSVGAESITGVGQFDFGKTKFVPRGYFEGMKRGVIEDRDVLVYKDGGRPGYFIPHVSMFGDGFPFSQFCINEHVYRLRVKPPLTQSYMYFWLNTPLLLDQMHNYGTGVAIPGINSTAMRSLTVLIPPQPVVQAFEELVAPMVSLIFNNAKESKTLAETRDALLPKLLSGEVAVA